jgi:hypothetical protein
VFDAAESGAGEKVVVTHRGGRSGAMFRTANPAMGYPPAVGPVKGPGLERGVDPRGSRADARYVPSRENRSQGSTMGSAERLAPADR